MTLSASEARSYIEDETQWTAAPCLSSDEVDRLLDRARIADSAGRNPADAGYVATYSTDSVRRSVAIGWRMKAGKAISHGDVRVGDVQVSGSSTAKFCMDMARRYAGSVGVNSVAGYSALWETY